MALSYSKKAEGIAELAMPYGDSTPLKTFTCGHCGRIDYVQPELALKAGIILRISQPPSVCHRCWSLVCAQCHGRGNCTTVEQVLIQIENKGQFLRSIGMG